MLTFLILLAGLAGLIWLPRSDVGETEEFVIERGDGSAKVARLLAERNLIRSRHLFIFYTILVGREKEFKAGRYLISPLMNIPEIVRIFSEGLAESDDVVVTIPEGANVAEISQILTKAGLARDFDISKFVDQEGYLFPDTYRLRNHQSPITNLQQNPKVKDFVQKMKENFHAQTDGLFEGLTVQRSGEIIIIASMLEKEVKTAEDMRLVAGIIEKRLELGMPLEIDAAVAYGVCYPQFAAGEYCDVSQVNLVDNIPIDSGYNTYRRKGLPAGPIANPGLVAISSALDPEPSDYLYYLNGKDGTTILSKTAAEHQRARRKHLGY